MQNHTKGFSCFEKHVCGVFLIDVRFLFNLYSIRFVYWVMYVCYLNGFKIGALISW